MLALFIVTFSGYSALAGWQFWHLARSWQNKWKFVGWCFVLGGTMACMVANLVWIVNNQWLPL